MVILCTEEEKNNMIKIINHSDYCPFTSKRLRLICKGKDYCSSGFCAEDNIEWIIKKE